MDKLFREQDDERASYSTYCKLITAFSCHLEFVDCRRLPLFWNAHSVNLGQNNFKSNFKWEYKRDCSNVNVLGRRANCDETINIRQVYHSTDLFHVHSYFLCKYSNGFFVYKIKKKIVLQGHFSASAKDGMVWSYKPQKSGCFTHFIILFCLEMEVCLIYRKSVAMIYVHSGSLLFRR